jgi:hypothetical protein
MGMMGKWMEAEAQLGIRVKLTIDSPSNACWEGQDAKQCLRDGECTIFVIPIPGLTYLI